MRLEDYLVNKGTTIRTCMELMNQGKRTLVVVDEDKLLLGTLTDGDIRRWILKGNSIDRFAEEAICINPTTASESRHIDENSIFKDMQIDLIPIVDKNNRVIDLILSNVGDRDLQKEKINVPVVIMAGGKGERLMPYTSIVPKPLIPIGEKPISELVIESFKNFGCNEFFFTLNYKKNMIKAYYDELERDYSVRYVEEDEPLGTGGSLYYIKDELKSTFFVSNCDILLNVDYADVLKFHKKNSNIITVVTSLKKYTIPYGTVKLDENGRIKQLVEKPSMDYLVNTGVYILEPEVFEYMQTKKKIHLTEIVERCLKDGKNVGTYPISEDAWMDMGQFEDMKEMKRRLSI